MVRLFSLFFVTSFRILPLSHRAEPPPPLQRSTSVSSLLWGFGLAAALVVPSALSAQGIDKIPVPATLDGRLYNPAPSPYSILSTQASRVLPHLALWGQISIDYANDLLVGQKTTRTTVGDKTTETKEIITRPLAHRLAFELGLAFGLFNWVDLMISLPFYGHGSDSYPYVGRPSYLPVMIKAQDLGAGDLRFGFKARLLDNASAGGLGLALAFDATAPTGGSWMGYGGWTLRPRFLADFRLANGFLVAFNFSYTSPSLGSNGPTPGAWGIPEASFQHEFRLELGAEIPLFFEGFSLVAETQLSLLPPVAKVASDSVTFPLPFQTPLEFRAAFRWRHRLGFVLTLGGGTGLTSGYAAPDFRVFFNVAFGQALVPESPRPLETPVTVHALSKDPSPPPPRRRPPPRETLAELPKTPEPPPLRANSSVSSEAFDQALARSPKQLELYGDPSLDPGLAKDPCKRPLKPGESRPATCPDETDGKILVTATKIVLKEQIFFASNSDKLEERSFDILKRLASVLRSNTHLRLIQIEGHTDSRGDLEQNVDLSERRSQRVKAFLVQEGVQSERMVTKGFGPTKPLTTNKTHEGRAKNRRVDFLVLQISKPLPSQGDPR